MAAVVETESMDLTVSELPTESDVEQELMELMEGTEEGSDVAALQPQYTAFPLKCKYR